MEPNNGNISFPDVDLLTECSWEVCNKIGGIYTVLSTKAVELKKIFGDRLVFIGPDLNKDEDADQPLFKERKTIFRSFGGRELPYGIKARCGRWAIPGSPLVILVDFKPVFSILNDIFGEMWNQFGVDSLHAYGDYEESCAFAVAASIVTIELGRHLKIDPSRMIAHYDEWTTGMGLLYMKSRQPETATVFTTHATTTGRSICGNGKPLYQYFENYNGDQMAGELNVEAKHSVEKAAAWNADCFTTVSDVTARECRQLIGRQPDVVTPNGFEPSFVPETEKWSRLRKNGRKKILKIASLLYDCPMPDDTFIVATSGRNEFRNKGLDLFLDSMKRLAEKAKEQGRQVLALVLVPAWVKQPSGDLLVGLDFGGWIKPDPDYLTHRLYNEDSDSIAVNIRRINFEMKNAGCDKNLHLVFVPSYLDGHDGIVNISYYDFLPALDISVFCSYYEPWGYTPLESIAFGVPTVTTDKAGFGEWVRTQDMNGLERHGVAVINREDTNYDSSADEISSLIASYMQLPLSERTATIENAGVTAGKAEWKLFIGAYKDAYGIALENARRRIQNQV